MNDTKNKTKNQVSLAEKEKELEKLAQSERPQVCSINTSVRQKEHLLNVIDRENEQIKQKLSNLSVEKPEVCSIDKNATPQVCEIDTKGAPDVCEINTSYKPTVPGIDTNTEGEINIADTYGINVPVSEEERRKLVELLNKEEKKYTSKATIRVIKNGPYIVEGDLPVYDGAIKINEIGQSIGWDKVRKLKEPKVLALCRCGHSKHMPFCDESHLKEHFDGTCTAKNKPYNEAADIYRGCPGVYLMDEESLCAIVRFCDPHGSCWNLVKSDDTVDIAKEQTFNCASGRLTLIKDNKKVEPELEQEIECIYDTERDVLGPLWVKGGIPVKTDETDYEVRNRQTLCRCGRSYNKPFCDGMHLTCPKLNEEEIEEND